MLLLALSLPSSVLGATTQATCMVNLRTSASTSATIATAISAGTTVTVDATVSGTTWSTSCLGVSATGTTWYRITAVGGSSVSALYSVTYVYAVTSLFTAVASPTPTPTPTPATVQMAAQCDSINLRLSPSTTGTIEGMIYTGTQVTVAATVAGGS